jgi:hypothetical protein
VPAFSLAPQLVVGTDRVATITTRLAVKYAERLPLKLLPMPIAIPPMVEMLQWHQVHDHDPANQWFRRLLKKTVSGLAHDDAPNPVSGPERRGRSRTTAQRRGPRRRHSSATA